MVALRIKTVESEVKAILAARRAVAGAGIATCGGEDRHDIELEGNGAGFFRVFYCNCDFGGEAAVGDM